MKNLLLIFALALSYVSFGQTVPMTNNVPWYEFSKKLSVGKFMLKSAGEYDTSFTIPANTASITLDTIAADKTVTFSDGSAYDKGVVMYVQNSNNSAFVWNVAGNVKEADGTVISNLPRGLHIFYWNSNAWIRLSTSGGSSPTVDTLTFTSPLVQLDKNVSLDFDAFPQDTVGVVEHNDSLFNILYSHTGVRDSTFIVLLSAGGGGYASGGTRMDVDTVKLSNTPDLIDQDIYLNVATPRTINLANETGPGYLQIDASGAVFGNTTTTAGLLALTNNMQEFGHIAGNNYAGFTSDANLDLSATSAFNAFPITRLAATLTANRTLTTIAGTARNERWTIINSNSGSFAWQIAGASLYEMDGTAITALENQKTYDFVWNDALTRWQRKSGGASGGGITALTGDVTASGTGSVAATLATVNTFVGQHGQPNYITKYHTDGKGRVISVDSGLGKTWPAERTIGTIYEKYTWKDLADFTTQANTTISLSSGYPRLVSSTAAWSNVTKLLNKRPTLLNKWKFTVNVKIISTPSASTTGFGPGIYSNNSAGANYGMLAYVNCTNTGSNGVANLAKQDGTGATSQSGMSLTTNDVIEMIVEMKDSSMTFKVRNLTTGGAQFTATKSFTVATSTLFPPNTGVFSFVNFGGTYEIQYIKIESDEVKNPALIYAFDSKGQIYNTYFQTRPVRVLNATYPTAIQYSGGGDQLKDLLDKKDEISMLNGEQVILGLGSNDLRYGASLATTIDRYVKVVNMLQAGGATVLHVQIPEDSTAGGLSGLTAFKNWVAAAYPSTYIDCWTPMSTGNKLTAGYNNGDGIHPNPAGQAVIASTISASGLVKVKSIWRESQITKSDGNIRLIGDSIALNYGVERAPSKIAKFDDSLNIKPSMIYDDYSKVIVTTANPVVQAPGSPLFTVTGGIGANGTAGGFIFGDRTNTSNYHLQYSDQNAFRFDYNGTDNIALSTIGQLRWMRTGPDYSTNDNNAWLQLRKDATSLVANDEGELLSIDTATITYNQNETNSWVAAINKQTMTGTSRTITNAASLFLDVPVAGGTNTVSNAYSLYVGAGKARMRSVQLSTAGDKLEIATGSNASIGTATLVAGTVTVNTTAVTSSSIIMVSHNTPGGTVGIVSAPVASIVNGTSFVINSSNAADTSTINWWIVN